MSYFPRIPRSNGLLMALLFSASPCPLQADFTIDRRVPTARDNASTLQGAVTSLSAPALSEGKAACRGTLRVGGSSQQALFIDGNRVAGYGDRASGSVSPIGFLHSVFANRSGKVAFSGRADEYGMWTNATGALSLIAGEGSPAPGTNGNFALLQNAPISAFNDQGKVVFQAFVQGAPSGTAAGLWMGLPGGLTLVAREGSLAADSPAGAEYRSIGQNPLLNDAGEVAFYSNISQPWPEYYGANNRTVLYTGKPGALQAVMRSGDPAPDTEGDIYFRPLFQAFGFNENGAVAFKTNLWTPGPNPMGNGDAIYTGTKEHLRLVARTGFPAPDAESGVIFRTLYDPAINAAGEVLFLAQAGPANGVTKDGIWTGRPGQLRLIARIGDPAPGTALVYYSVTPLALSDSGQVSFSAQLKNAPAGQESALYATDETGAPRLIVRKGFPILGSNPVVGFDFHPASGGPRANGNGRPSSLDSQGRFAFFARWWDAVTDLPTAPGNEAIYVATPGTSAPIIPPQGQPANVAAVSGKRAEFQVTVLGTRPATYQWKHHGSPVLGETGPVLSLNAVSPADRGSYTVVVTNTHGSLESAPATLTLPPLIITRPVSQSVAAGSSPPLTVVAGGFGTFSYAWAWQAPGAASFTPLGVTTASLTLTNVVVGQAGRYRVVVTNEDGPVTSAEAMLTVAPLGSAIIERIVFKGDRAVGFPGELFIFGSANPMINQAGEVAFHSGFQDAAGTRLPISIGVYGGKRDAMQFYLRDGSLKNLNDSGRAVIFSNFLDSDQFKNDGTLMGPAGAVEILAQEGSPAPGTTHLFSSSGTNPAVNGQGIAAFWQGTGAGPVIYYGKPGALIPLLISGQQAPGMTPGVTISGMEQAVVLNETGTAAFFSYLSGTGITTANNEGIWLGMANSTQRVFAEGGPAPGAGTGVRFGSWSDGRSAFVRINTAGQLAFANRLEGIGVDSANDGTIFAGTPAALQIVAREGMTAAGHTFLGLVNAGPPVLINENGQVAFAAYVDPTGGAQEYLQSLWRWTPGVGAGTLQLIVREGQAVPGLPAGVIFDSTDYGSTYFDFAVNRAGQFAFTSFLAGTGINNANHNNAGLFLTSAAGDVKLVARGGDLMDVGGGVMKALYYPGFSNFRSGGGDGLARLLNDSGELVFSVQFDADGLETGVFRAKLPGTSTVTPFVLTKTATGVSPSSAVLQGLVNPADPGTTARFDYGETTSYGNQTPLQTVDAGSSSRDVAAWITGLRPNTAYHYRLSATNANGLAQGYDLTFTTAAASPTFADWAGTNNLGNNPNPDKDTDSDGHTDFEEYVFHGDPNKSEPVSESLGRLTIGGTQWLTLRYRRWTDREAAGVTYTPQVSPPAGWSSTGLIDEVDPDAPIIPGSTAWRCRILIDPAKGTQLLRVKAVKL